MKKFQLFFALFPPLHSGHTMTSLLVPASKTFRYSKKPPSPIGYPPQPQPGYGYSPQPQPGYGYPPQPSYGYPYQNGYGNPSYK